MNARVTRSETAPDKVEEGANRIKEVVIPQVKKLQGFKGGYWLIDRKTGKGFGVTLFENEAALRATEDAAAKIRVQVPTGTKITGVESYEVVGTIPVQGPAAAARATKFEASPDKFNEVTKFVNGTVIPSTKKIAGVKGGYWLIDRHTGKGLALALFEDAAAVRASEDSAAKIRSQATQELNVKFTGVEQYEVYAQAVAEPAMASR
jgi:hypothetical protein